MYYEFNARNERYLIEIQDLMSTWEFDYYTCASVIARSYAFVLFAKS